MAWVSRRAPRTDRTRAAALLWGGWVLVTGLVFSYMNGIIHPYYMVALAPGIAALTGIGAMTLRRARLGLAGRIVAAGGVLATAVWAYVLLDRTPDWLPWLRWVVLLAGVAAASLVLAGPALAGPAPAARSRRARLALAVAPLGLALVAGLAGPAAYALDTVGTAHTGAIPSAGPQAAGFGGPGGGPGGQGGFPGTGQIQARSRRGRRLRRGQRTGRRHHGEQRPDQAARAGRGQLQVGGRHRGLGGRGAARAGHR